MQLTRPRWRAWASVGAFCTLLAAGLGAPLEVWADCSHPSDRPAFGLDLASPLVALGTATIHPVDSTPPPQPCDGPQCSGKSAPAPVAEAPPPPPPSEWALAGTVAPPTQATTLAMGFEPALVWPAHASSSVFHPPRRSR